MSLKCRFVVRILTILGVFTIDLTHARVHPHSDLTLIQGSESNHLSYKCVTYSGVCEANPSTEGSDCICFLNQEVFPGSIRVIDQFERRSSIVDPENWTGF